MRRLNHMPAPGIAARCARLVLCAAVAGCTPPRTPADLVFDHVTVVDTRTGALLADRSLAVHAGRIVSIAAAGRVRFVATATRVDASGRYAVPGLWDAHTHVMQEDTALTIRQLAPLALASGVTHIRDMSSSLEARRAYRAWARGDGAAAPEAISPGPALWGIRLPYGDPRRQLVVTTRAAMVQALDSLARDSVDFVKVYSGFGPAALSTLDTLARERGLALSGHVQEGVTLAQHAATGFRTIEHVDFTTFGACVDDPASYFARVIQARFGGSGETVPAVYVAFGAAVTPDVCLAALANVQRAGTAFTPTLAVSFATPADVAATDTVALPPMLRADCARYLAEFARTSPADQAAFQQVGLMLTGLARRAGVRILAGTDGPTFCAAPGVSLSYELQLLRRAGLSPLEVLQAATLLPSTVLLPARRLGVLDTGYEAHVLLLRRNPLTDVSAYSMPAGLYTRGRWFDGEALSRLRAEAVAFTGPLARPAAP